MSRPYTSPGPRTKGPELAPHQVVLKPLVTEKGVHFSEALNQYSFEVNQLATKTEIKQSIEQLFDVKVAKVATQTRRGKHRRFRARLGKTRSWKKAIVTLKPDFKINFY